MWYGSYHAAYLLKGRLARHSTCLGLNEKEPSARGRGLQAPYCVLLAERGLLYEAAAAGAREAEFAAGSTWGLRRALIEYGSRSTSRAQLARASSPDADARV